MNSNIFFNIDTQQDFFSRDSIDIPNGESILKNLSIVSNFLKEKNIKTIHTIRWFKPDSNFFSELPDYKKSFPKHCLFDTKGARFINETAPTNYFLINWIDGKLIFPEIHNNTNIVVTKKSPSLFEGNTFTEALVNNLGVPFMERPNYIIYGINVGPTALGLMRRGYEVHIVQDANIGFNGYPLRKEDIIPQQTAPQSEGGLLGQSTGMEYPAPEEDNAITFITTKDIIGS